MIDLIAELFAAFVEAVLAYLFGGKKTKRVLHWVIVLTVLGALIYGAYHFFL